MLDCHTLPGRGQSSFIWRKHDRGGIFVLRVFLYNAPCGVWKHGVLQWSTLCTAGDTGGQGGTGPPLLKNSLKFNKKMHKKCTKLESLQLQAAYAVSGSWKGTPAKKVYEELGWEWLSPRRWYRRMSLFFKIVNKISSKYITDCITFPNPSWISVYGREQLNTNTNMLTPFSSRIFKFQSSFFPSCVFSWNRELTYTQRNAVNINLFNKKSPIHIQTWKKCKLWYSW